MSCRRGGPGQEVPAKVPGSAVREPQAAPSEICSSFLAVDAARRRAAATAEEKLLHHAHVREREDALQVRGDAAEELAVWRRIEHHRSMVAGVGRALSESSPSEISTSLTAPQLTQACDLGGGRPLPMASERRSPGDARGDARPPSSYAQGAQAEVQGCASRAGAVLPERQVAEASRRWQVRSDCHRAFRRMRGQAGMG